MRLFKTKKGKEIALLNPAEKGKKFSEELKTKTRQTNQGEVKVDKDGKPSRLTKQQAAYRSGYLEARKDSAKAYKFNQKKKAAKKKAK